MDSDKQWIYIKNIITRQRALPVIKRRHKWDNIPVSLTQQRLWIIQEMDPGNYAYNMFFPLSIDGPLDVKVFDEALNTVIGRHEILRTTFENNGGTPYQKVHKRLIVNTEECSFYGDKDSAFDWIMEKSKKPFDLKKLPLLRTYRAKINESKSYLMILIHHIVGDAWAMNIVLEELQSIYNAKIAGRIVTLNEPELQFSDYAFWEKDNFRRYLADKINYWKAKLPDRISNLNLHTDYKRPIKGSYRGKMVGLDLDTGVYQGLKELQGQFPGASMFMIILAAYRLLLYKYSGESNFLIGSPVSNRVRKDTKNLVGYLANMVVLYTDINNDMAFTDVLKSEMQTCLEAYENQDFPYEYLLENLEYKREANRNPLFQTAITFQTITKEELTFGEASGRVVDVQREASMFDLLILIYDNGKNLFGWFEYSTDLFHENTIKLMAKHFSKILENIIKDPGVLVGEINLVTPVDKKLIRGLNDTQYRYSDDKCIHHLFEERVVDKGQATALVDKNRSITYEELNNYSNQLATYLLSESLETSTIGICMDYSFDMVIAMLAILKAGFVYVPLDAELPEDRIYYMLEDCNAGIVLVDEQSRNKLHKYNGKLVTVKEKIWSNTSVNNIERNVTSKQLAYVIYTSGTSGRPKGVMVEHQSVVNVIEWVNRKFNVNERDRLLLVTSIGFDLSIYDIFGTLAAGASIFLPRKRQLIEPREILRIMKEYNITLWDSAPATLMQLLPIWSEYNFKFEDMRLFLLSGDWIPTNIPAQLDKKFPNAKLIALGGATEATIWSNYYEVDARQEYWKSIPYGRPIQNAEYFILDESKNICPIGIEGDLYIGGKCLARGYLNNIDLTGERFIVSEFGRIYFTGDRARYMLDGNIEFLGRRDTQVKIRGFRIELEEIRHIIEMYSKISVAEVLALNDDSNDKYLVAFIVWQGENLQDMLKEYLRSKLPAYMVPSVYIELDSIPYTKNGKVDRERLMEMVKQHNPIDIVMNPETKLQKDLLNIWKLVLKQEKIGVDTDFFEAGGHSLLVAKLISSIKETLDLDVMVQDIFMNSTVRSLEQCILSGKSKVSYIDIEKEADIDIIKGEQEYSGAKNKLLLTGCTGFIGRFLLHQLLTSSNAVVYCLLNKEHDESGLDRLKSIMIRNELWLDEFEGRIVPIIGSLKEERLGLDSGLYNELSEKIDVIYHNGAIASYLDHYNTLKRTNVFGTKEIIKLASCTKIKPIHFSSTITVFNAGEYRTVNEYTSIREERHEYYPGYFASKWVAEELINKARKHNIPCNIYRFGLMTGDTLKGRYDKGQWLYQLLKGFLQLGYAFDKMPDFNHAILPIDVGVKMVCRISFQDNLLNKNYFICNPERVPVQSFINHYNMYAKKQIKVISFYNWLRITEEYIKEKDELLIYYFVQHLSYFNENELNSYINNDKRRLDINNTKTKEIVEKLGIEIPEISSKLIYKYFNYIISTDKDLEKRDLLGDTSLL